MSDIRILGEKSFASFDTMCWPLPGERCGDIEWKLRYAPGTLTRADQLVTASILSAYREMVAMPETRRRPILRRLREALRLTHAVTGSGE